jgi:hypothetical protein
MSKKDSVLKVLVDRLIVVLPAVAPVQPELVLSGGTIDSDESAPRKRRQLMLWRSIDSLIDYHCESHEHPLELAFRCWVCGDSIELSECAFVTVKSAQTTVPAPGRASAGEAYFVVLTCTNPSCSKGRTARDTIRTWMKPRVGAEGSECTRLRICGGCAKAQFAGEETQATKFRQCSCCHVTYYCSEACQRKIWPRHRRVCLSLMPETARRATGEVKLFETIRVAHARDPSEYTPERLAAFFTSMTSKTCTVEDVLAILEGDPTHEDPYEKLADRIQPLDPVREAEVDREMAIPMEVAEMYYTNLGLHTPLAIHQAVVTNPHGPRAKQLPSNARHPRSD